MKHSTKEWGGKILLSSIPAVLSETGKGVRDWLKDKRQGKIKPTTKILDKLEIKEIEEYLEKRKNRQRKSS